MNTSILTRLQGLLGAAPFMAFTKLGAAERRTGDGTATAATYLPFEPHLKNHIGTQHAGALFTVAYTSARAAAEEALGGAPLAAARFESSIQFRKPGKGAVWVSSQAHAVSPGEVRVDSTLHSEGNEPIAQLTITFTTTPTA
ncbi:DUF4442 domain-containing protein [Limnobacter humi]|uniref:DUF4442 domain-containing protein n=1 Tax=Limnobacter humi TaxID=1778671 RepID=A0ABT1WDY6_9BURK|nr:DUF4442 domain-containing protein [Limnobacter humi]MCQ8895736.1 DUF4442 domain-containing protein [Limnobacter humi]